MLIRGEIGQECQVNAEIAGAVVDEGGITYRIKLNGSIFSVPEDKVTIKGRDAESIIQEAVEKTKKTEIPEKKIEMEVSETGMAYAKRLDDLINGYGKPIRELVDDYNKHSQVNIGLSTMYAYKYLKLPVPMEKRKALAEFFNVDVAYLMGDQEERRKFGYKKATVESTMKKVEKYKKGAL